jgi:hypothetical protein
VSWGKPKFSSGQSYPKSFGVKFTPSTSARPKKNRYPHAHAAIKRRQKREAKRLKYLTIHRPDFEPRPRKELAVLPPDIERILTLYPDSPTPHLSRWLRVKGRWCCVLSDAPFEWFCRVSDPRIVEQHLHSQHIPKQWGPPLFQIHTARTGRDNLAAHPPAPSEKGKNPSEAQAVNSGTALDPHTAGRQEERLKAPVTSSLERNGFCVASPLNGPARAGELRNVVNPV